MKYLVIARYSDNGTSVDLFFSSWSWQNADICLHLVAGTPLGACAVCLSNQTFSVSLIQHVQCVSPTISAMWLSYHMLNVSLLYMWVVSLLPHVWCVSPTTFPVCLSYRMWTMSLLPYEQYVFPTTCSVWLSYRMCSVSLIPLCSVSLLLYAKCLTRCAVYLLYDM